MNDISTVVVTEKRIATGFTPTLSFDILENQANAVLKIEARYNQLKEALNAVEGLDIFQEPIRTYLPDGSTTLSYRKKVHIRFKNRSAEFEPVKQIISKYMKAYFKIVTY